MDDILTEVGRPDLVKSLDGGTQATVDTEDLAVDDGGEGEIVEYLGAVPPHSDAPVLPQALVVEAVHLGDLS